MLMHQVGREYARAHRLTLATLQRYVPRSNDPNCSAGFGMGLVMYLGPEILRSGGSAAANACAGLPTRYREYTCVHGLGHALMRAHHGDLGEAARACRGLRRAYAPDCAQGAFHDYWISLRGADGTTRPRHANRSPRSICDGRFTYIRPCWYRYFLEQPLSLPVRTPSDLLRSCQMRICSRLHGADAAACLRGVPDQTLAGRPARHVGLIRACGRMAVGVRPGCYEWLGRTLAVVTNGAFRERGCAKLAPSARRACVAGAMRMNAALVTFS